MSQPQWFYSALAQVTAAIVGFIGGFLLLRLLELLREWRTLTERLEDRQARWSHAEFLERQYDQIHEAEIGPYKGERLKLSNDQSASWSDLYKAIQERELVKMPRELLWALATVTVIALVFALGPLLVLDAPSILERASWLGGLALALALIAFLLAATVRSRHKELHAYELHPHTQARLDDYEMWIEGMQEQERQQKERLEAERKTSSSTDAGPG